ncbi:hypothetical protein NQ315_001120 [Exocentrus adspersus]|uniref:GST N-terminal domain-containing protein n=1 Tax=Exocentrus adspersus TaxID=1586481 RepID=A0AAV8WE25_9CUCU|nr:hypothetical protein NQ315_001120 [Exocentrus adspersus]
MPVKLYGIDGSPAVRATLLTLKALNLEFEFKEVNPIAGEQYSPEVLKLNPLHTVPTIQDGNFAIWDSHAINSYLVDEYGKDDSLYPKDLEKRAVVNQRMYFDCGVLFPKMGAALVPVVRQGAKTVAKHLEDSLVEASNTTPCSC